MENRIEPHFVENPPVRGNAAGGGIELVRGKVVAPYSVRALAARTLIMEQEANIDQTPLKAIRNKLKKAGLPTDNVD